jgi:predicted enzyme related to lactoylglutathione lyase
MTQLITTFEINALDLDRAVEFYIALLGREVVVKDIGGEQGGLLSSAEDPIMGVIRSAPEYVQPSDQGNNIYFRVEHLDGAL